MEYTTPNVEGMNASAAPRGWLYQNSVAVSEQYVLALIAGVFVQTIFQFDTSYPISVNNEG